MIRRYGRNIPDPLPAKKMLTRVSPALPQMVDLRQWAGPTKDQFNESCCTGFAFSSAREWIARKYPRNDADKSVILSPQYLYAEALIAQGDFPQDSGSDGTTLCKTLISKGCCEASLYPYFSGQILKPTAAQEANAALYKTGAYHGIANSQVALSVLGDAVPWPVAIGFTIYESFESDALAQTGIMTVPGAGEKVLGGHEVLCLGYDQTKQLALIQNSWGDSWGQKGYFWMPFVVLDAADTDLKISHTGRPWVAR
jgi:C1A family cysteine protease